MTKQEAIKKAIEVMEEKNKKSVVIEGVDCFLFKPVKVVDFPSVAQQIIEELGYDD